MDLCEHEGRDGWVDGGGGRRKGGGGGAVSECSVSP